MIRLKRNPLSGKQLIWPIILHYLLTPCSHQSLDFNTQPAWDCCAEGFVCLVMAEKYLMFDPPLAQCSYVQCDLVFNKIEIENEIINNQKLMSDRGYISGLHLTQHQKISHLMLKTTSDDAMLLHFQD